MDRHDWNQRYAGSDLVWSAAPNMFLVEEVAELPPGRALDAAAGEGRNAIWLAERGWRVDAVDYSETGLDKAKRVALARDVTVDWMVADLLEWVPTPAAYDLVLVFYLHLPWAEMRRVLRQTAAAVAPGGTFLLVGHDRTNLLRGHGGPKSAQVLYEPDEVAAELTGLRVTRAERKNRPVEAAGDGVVAIDCLVLASAPPG